MLRSRMCSLSHISGAVRCHVFHTTTPHSDRCGEIRSDVWRWCALIRHDIPQKTDSVCRLSGSQSRYAGL